MATPPGRLVSGKADGIKNATAMFGVYQMYKHLKHTLNLYIYIFILLLIDFNTVIKHETSNNSSMPGSHWVLELERKCVSSSQVPVLLKRLVSGELHHTKEWNGVKQSSSHESPEFSCSSSSNCHNNTFSTHMEQIQNHPNSSKIYTSPPRLLQAIFRSFSHKKSNLTDMTTYDDLWRPQPWPQRLRLLASQGLGYERCLVEMSTSKLPAWWLKVWFWKYDLARLTLTCKMIKTHLALSLCRLLL